MKKSLALATVAAALMVAAPAFAGQRAPERGFAEVPQGRQAQVNASDRVDMARCRSLMRQLDTAIATHANSPRLSLAKKQRMVGENACLDGSYDEGQAMLKGALKDLGA